MTKQEQERSTNRILLTMAIAFGALIGMYYLYALVRPHNPPVFWVLCGLFVVCAGVMFGLAMNRSKQVGLGLVEGYKKNLKARFHANFAIFFLVCAALNVVCALSSNLKQVMVIIAWAICIYTIALIIFSSIHQHIVGKREKKKKISAKAAQKAAKKQLRNS